MPEYVFECKVCGDTFTATKKNARFCSDRCRKRASRTHTVTALSDQPEERPITDEDARGAAAHAWMECDGTRSLHLMDWQDFMKHFNSYLRLVRRRE